MLFKTERQFYWDSVALTWQKKSMPKFLRLYSDALHTELFTRWYPEERIDRILKTDLFDEALTGGVYSLLEARSNGVYGVDISDVTLDAVRNRCSSLRMAQADVRFLPFKDGAFDLVVSNSTLDHFEALDGIVVSLRELRRVLQKGGQLLLTLDNRSNPFIALRNALPFKLLYRLGIVPYYSHAFFGAQKLQKVLQRLDFDIIDVDTYWHFPRVIAYALTKIVEKYATSMTQRRFLRFFLSFERLSKWRTRFVTGHFIAIRSIKN